MKRAHPDHFKEELASFNNFNPFLKTFSETSRTITRQASFAIPEDVSSQKPLHEQPQAASSTQGWTAMDVDKSNKRTLPRITTNNGVELRAVEDLPFKYRSVFSAFPYFNEVQSVVFDSVLNSDKPLVLCSPTGSGKTVIFELAIIRLLMKRDLTVLDTFKVIYLAPLKMMCTERFGEWKAKFERFGLECLELTGDSEFEYTGDFKKASIIITTPEKWDIMTRSWRDNRLFMTSICLFCVDEIHLIHDGTRGATIEAVISRMKTIQSASQDGNDLRLIAVSATAPNVEDIGEWLGTRQEPGASFNLMSSTNRPCDLRQIVLGFPCPDSWNDFRFESSLTWKLDQIIKKYNESKPTLIFCGTRKSTENTALHLAKGIIYFFNTHQRRQLDPFIVSTTHSKLRETLQHGIAFHHAGMSLEDRRLVENAFASGILPVLVSTSTLAMGVNLPAHLVIIKSTSHYIAGNLQEYNESHILQMIGRAGRPQFDKTATAVIMTKEKLKRHYENLLSGTQIIESNLHKHLVEHLNAEIVLKTITNRSIAMEWLRSTFFYIRVHKNPKYYGVTQSNEAQKIDQSIEMLCVREVNALKRYGIIKIEDNRFVPTSLGQLMAKHCISLDSVKKFLELNGDETIANLIEKISSCEELIQETHLRVSERKALNDLNKNSNAKTIRFQLKSKVKSTDLKVNCLIQATFGCLPINDPSMSMEVNKLMRVGQRVSRCLSEVVQIQKPLNTNSFALVKNAILIAKCFRCRLWFDSEYIFRQLNKIGQQMTLCLIENDVHRFQDLAKKNPRTIEGILNKNPPFGNQLIEQVKHLPEYQIKVEQLNLDKIHSNNATIKISLRILNCQNYKQKRTTTNYHSGYLIVGDGDNKLILCQKISDNTLINSKEPFGWTKEISVEKSPNNNSREVVFVHFISESWAGLDVETKIEPKFTHSFERRILVEEVEEVGSTSVSKIQPPKILKTTCGHKCGDKTACGHLCCKSLGQKRKDGAFASAKAALGSAEAGKKSGNKKMKDGNIINYLKVMKKPGKSQSPKKTDVIEETASCLPLDEDTWESQLNEQQFATKPSSSGAPQVGEKYDNLSDDEAEFSDPEDLNEITFLQKMQSEGRFPNEDFQSASQSQFESSMLPKVTFKTGYMSVKTENVQTDAGEFGANNFDNFENFANITSSKSQVADYCSSPCLLPKIRKTSPLNDILSQPSQPRHLFQTWSKYIPSSKENMNSTFFRGSQI